MEFKGTTQEWFIGENQSTIISKDSCLIARIFDGKGNSLLDKKEQSNEIVYANARLIACAPELLEALIHTLEVLYQCDCPKELHETYANLFMNYNNLIKKATEL